GQHLLYSRGIGNVTDHLLIGAGADLLFDFHADGLQVKAEFLEDIDGDTLAQLDEAEQQVLGTHEIMVEAVSLLARQRQHLLCPWRKIIHRFIAHKTTSTCYHYYCLSNPAAGGPEGLAMGRLTGFKRSRTMSARSR